MPPSLLTVGEVQGFDSLLCCLVSGEAGPFVTAVRSILGSGFQVAPCLIPPVLRSLCHVAASGGSLLVGRPPIDSGLWRSASW